MKKFLSVIIVLIFTGVVFAAGPFPHREFGEDLGKDGRSYNDLYLKNKIIFEGATSNTYEGTLTASDVAADRTWTLPDKSGTIAMTTDVSTAAPAVNNVTNATADATIAFTAYQGTFTSTLTNKDMFTFQGLGAFGDVSVMRIEQKTGNATDGTVLEVVSADANVDPLVVSSSAQAGVLTVGQGGTVDIIGATGITGAVTITGDVGVTGTISATGAFYQAAIAAAASGNTNLTVDASGNGTITVGGTSTGNTIFPGAVVANGNVDIGNAATDTLTITSIIDSNVTLDDGTTDSPSLILKDATDQTAVLTKTDGSVTTFTTAAAGGLSIRTGNLWVGNGSPGTAAMDGEDFYVEGDSEFDGAIQADALITAALGATISGATTSINASSNFATNINTGSSSGALSLGGGSGTVAVNSTTWDVSTAGAFTGVADITGTAGEAMTITIASDGAADDLTLSVTGATDSSVILSSAGTGADAIKLNATAGGIDIDSALASAGAIDIDATGTVAGNAITINTTDGGILIQTGGADNGDLTMTVADDAALNATGTVAITSSDWGISATGAVTNLASVGFDSATVIYYDTVECDNACVKALRGTPKALVAAPGANKFIELVSAVLILDYGSNVLTESADNLVIQYNTSGTDITAAIEATGFIDSSADIIKIVAPSAAVDVTAANAVNKAVELFNTGDGEYAGNAGNDTTMTIKVAYRIHADGL